MCGSSDNRRQRILINFSMSPAHERACFARMCGSSKSKREFDKHVGARAAKIRSRRMQAFTPGHRTRAMILEVRHLRILTAIADHGTVSAATKHVYLTQAAISHQLIELEQRLGLQFFHRTPRGMVATDAGAEMIEVARDVLARLATAEASMLRSAPRSAGRLRVGTDSAPALAWLPAAVAIVRRRLPHIRAELVPETLARGGCAVRG